MKLKIDTEKLIGPFRSGRIEMSTSSLIRNRGEVNFVLEGNLNKENIDRLQHVNYPDSSFYILENPKLDLDRVEVEGTHTFYANNRPYFVKEVPKEMPQIKKIIFNDPATIVIWSDGTKTVVKKEKRVKFDPYVGLSMCLSKKFFGSKHQMDKWIKEYYVEGEK